MYSRKQEKKFALNLNTDYHNYSYIFNIF